MEENAVTQTSIESISAFTILNYLFERSIDGEYLWLYEVLHGWRNEASGIGT
jgi:hypothetical protein